jgi:hypothetical protein
MLEGGIILSNIGGVHQYTSQSRIDVCWHIYIMPLLVVNVIWNMKPTDHTDHYLLKLTDSPRLYEASQA